MVGSSFVVELPLSNRDARLVSGRREGSRRLLKNSFNMEHVSSTLRTETLCGERLGDGVLEDSQLT